MRYVTFFLSSVLPFLKCICYRVKHSDDIVDFVAGGYSILFVHAEVDCSLVSIFKMADPPDFVTSEHLVDSSNDREYLSEWPPVNDMREESEQFNHVKRQRLDRAEEKKHPCVRELQEGERVLWARPALAKWWRKRQNDPGLKDCTKISKSDNPNTLLRYVAR